jgi:hypothetical protein
MPIQSLESSGEANITGHYPVKKCLQKFQRKMLRSSGSPDGRTYRERPVNSSKPEILTIKAMLPRELIGRDK